MAFRYILVTISHLITFTDLTEKLILFTAGCQVVYKSLDMHWQFMTRSSIHSLREWMSTKKKTFSWIPNLLSHTVPQMSLQHSQAAADTSWCWFFQTSFRWWIRQSGAAAAKLLHVSALHAFEVSAGLNATSAHWDPFYPWPAALRYVSDNTCVQLHSLEMNSFIFSEVSGVIITGTPHSLQV